MNLDGRFTYKEAKTWPEDERWELIRGEPFRMSAPATTWRDQTEKRALYERHGVREYWILTPDTLDLSVFHLEGGRFLASRGATLAQPVAVDLFPGLVLGPVQP